ncbi:uncharacterized protein LOC62_03G004775 [Vanrija pseudolonga]|uniref:Uncharacterized protein n=1 Tax=Vanrija pseudolonga TaxID=143232 RepID=A0AAF0YAT2_9TREE|nr:hypothetical protein LOC62_03G004775 [Vanrija pseudolonga]
MGSCVSSPQEEQTRGGPAMAQPPNSQSLPAAAPTAAPAAAQPPSESAARMARGEPTVRWVDLDLPLPVELASTDKDKGLVLLVSRPTGDSTKGWRFAILNRQLVPTYGDLPPAEQYGGLDCGYIGLTLIRAVKHGDGHMVQMFLTPPDMERFKSLDSLDPSIQPPEDVNIDGFKYFASFPLGAPLDLSKPLSRHFSLLVERNAKGPVSIAVAILEGDTAVVRRFGMASHMAVNPAYATLGGMTRTVKHGLDVNNVSITLGGEIVILADPTTIKVFNRHDYTLALEISPKDLWGLTADFNEKPLYRVNEFVPMKYSDAVDTETVLTSRAFTPPAAFPLLQPWSGAMELSKDQYAQKGLTAEANTIIPESVYLTNMHLVFWTRYRLFVILLAEHVIHDLMAKRKKKDDVESLNGAIVQFCVDYDNQHALASTGSTVAFMNPHTSFVFDLDTIWPGFDVGRPSIAGHEIAGTTREFEDDDEPAHSRFRMMPGGLYEVINFSDLQKEQYEEAVGPRTLPADTFPPLLTRKPR